MTAAPLDAARALAPATPKPAASVAVAQPR